MTTGRRVVGLIAGDRPGIVALVVESILGKGWRLGQVWAEARGGIFSLVVEFGDFEEITEPEIVATTSEWETALGAVTLISRLAGPFSPNDTASDFLADITIEGDRRSQVLAKATAAMAREKATITSIATTLRDGQPKYELHAMYSRPIGDSLRERLKELSIVDGFEFVPE